MAKGMTHESPVNASIEWYTPAWVFEKLGTSFDMDVASPEAGSLPWIPAREFITPSMDGLTYPWAGSVWCNPPYGPETIKWLARMDAHGNGIALVFARTDTRWFHQYVAHAYAICFIDGRIRFVDRDGKQGGSPGCGSMLVAWGEENAKVLERAKLGLVVHPTNPF